MLGYSLTLLTTVAPAPAAAATVLSLYSNRLTVLI